MRKAVVLMMNDWWGYGGGMGWGGWMMIVFGVIFLAAVIVGVVFLVRGVSSGEGTGGSHGRTLDRPVSPAGRSEDSASEIVRRRYAAGEIDREEYEQKMRDLDR